MGDIKPGMKTTEALFTMISAIVTILVMFKWLPSGDAASLEDAVKQIVVASITIASQAAIIIAYIRSRHQLKLEGMKNAQASDPVSTVPTVVLPSASGSPVASNTSVARTN